MFLCALLAWGLVLPPALAAQEPLDRVEHLMDEARFGEARETLRAWWGEGFEAASRIDVQHGLWLRALLTVDPGMAEADYRRLAVEFPGGPWSDDALLRLARGSELVGDLPAADRYLRLLVQDYPDSPHRAEARALRERLAAVTVLPPEAPGRADTSENRPPPDTTRPPRGDVAERTAARAGSLASAERETRSEAFAVQLGAFSTAARAQIQAARAKEAGLDIRIVRVEGSDLVRVRTGAFPTRSDADAEARRIRRLGFEAVVSADRMQESDVVPSPGAPHSIGASR